MSNINKQPLDENNNPHGEWIHYNLNGNLTYRHNFVHGIAHRLSEGYDQDNILMYRGCFDMGVTIGYWYFCKKNIIIYV